MGIVQDDSDSPDPSATDHQDVPVREPRAIRILIVDDLPIFRDGLRLLLSAHPRFEIVGDTTGDPVTAALVRELQPDVLLLGSVSADGGPLAVLKRLAAAQLSTRTILLVRSVHAPEILDALQFGARGVVARDSAAASLFESIDAVTAGAYWIGHERVVDDVAAMVRRFEHARNDAMRFGLSRREVEVVRAVVNGETNHEVAARLSITDNTVKRHLLNVFNKVGVSSRVELALFAVYHRLLDDD